MNAKHLIAAVAVLASAGSVLAQEYVVPDAGFSSTKTRAEVIAELHQARADGSLNFSDNTYPVLKAETSPRTRAEVIAELQQASANGALNFSDHDYPLLKVETSQKMREQVQAELAEYRAQHPYGDVGNDYSGGN